MIAMKKMVKISLYMLMLVGSFTAVSCRDTNPGNNEPDMGMTTDSIFEKNDTIDNNKSTSGADTEMDGE